MIKGNSNSKIRGEVNIMSTSQGKRKIMSWSTSNSKSKCKSKSKRKG